MHSTLQKWLCIVFGFVLVLGCGRGNEQRATTSQNSLSQSTDSPPTLMTGHSNNPGSNDMASSPEEAEGTRAINGHGYPKVPQSTPTAAVVPSVSKPKHFPATSLPLSVSWSRPISEPVAITEPPDILYRGQSAFGEVEAVVKIGIEREKETQFVVVRHTYTLGT